MSEAVRVLQNMWGVVDFTAASMSSSSPSASISPSRNFCSNCYQRIQTSTQLNTKIAYFSAKNDKYKFLGYHDGLLFLHFSRQTNRKWKTEHKFNNNSNHSLTHLVLRNKRDLCVNLVRAFLRLNQSPKKIFKKNKNQFLAFVPIF